MKRYIFSLLLGSCFVVWAVLPVRADWEFTKWGMSPEQVVQASNGRARPEPDEISSVLLKQDWQSGRFLFRVSYFFDEDKRGQRLTKIQLQLKNTELMDELLVDLKRKYGTPRGEIKGHVSGPYWEYLGDNINYLTDQKTVIIHYEPVVSKGKPSG
jgi:hypothetical protein